MNTFITKLLNRFSMYKVVSFSLTALFILALIFSLTGVLHFSALAMLASVGVFGFSVYLSSLVFGLVFSVRVHTESTFITAMILFFIFSPTLEVSGLASFALIGLIAAASKFILTFRGRHIFNPAAIAAFIISLTGLAYASWWVGTPPMVPLTLLVGYLIIQKTRRVHMSGTFMFLAAALVFVTLLYDGVSVTDSFVLLLSWPIFFFSSFMLTEPLTMPPKKWQQVVEALVVAVLFAIPIHTGDFVTGPAFALIAGNAIGFIWRRQQSVSLKFKGMKQLTPTSFEFIFTPMKKIRHESGQYAELTIPHRHDDLRGSRRSFSITSAPGDTEMRFGIKFYDPSSSLKKALKIMKKGTVIEATGISGDFTLPKDISKPLLFIAGGIGITPFISHIQRLKKVNEQRDIVLIYAVSNLAEVAYKDIIVKAGIKVVLVTKDAHSDMLPDKWIQESEAFITKELLQRNISDVSDRLVYISGPPLMIDGASRYLKQLGAGKIKTDYFIGY